MKFNKKHSDKIKKTLSSFEFPKGRKDIKSFLAYQLIKHDFGKNQKFIKKLYKDNYSDPNTQTSILASLVK